MSYLTELRANCERCRAMNLPTVYVTMYREMPPCSDYVRLTELAGPVSTLPCVSRERHGGGWEVAAFFRVCDVLTFLDAVEARLPAYRNTWHDVVVEW